MNALLRALLLRNRYCAPAGADGELPGGAAAEQDDTGDDADLEAGSSDDAGDDEDGDAGEGEDGEIVVTLGAEGGAADDDADEDTIAEALGENTPGNAAFAKLRATKQRFKREGLAKDALIRDLQAQVQASKPAPAAIDVGAEPDPDDYEMFEASGKAKFKTDFAAWNQRKADADRQARERQESVAAEQTRWQDRVGAVDKASGSLKVKDLDDANTAFATSFSPLQQAIIVNSTEDPKDAALLRYALGTNPTIAKKLAEEKDPVRFAFKAAKLLFKELNVATRKTAPPPPERRVRSAVAGAAAVDNQLARLEAEAEKSGNRDKVLAYKRQQKDKQAA